MRQRVNPGSSIGVKTRAACLATVFALSASSGLTAPAAKAASQPAVAGTSAADARPRLANLSHLDFLYDTVAPPDQARHTTYRLEQEPSIGVVWVYSQRQADGSYTHVGGGAHDPATNTWGQGSYDTDDITRNAIAYLRHWRLYGDEHSKRHAYHLLRGTAYFQTISGPNRGNFMIWMQPNGTLVPQQVPHDGNDEQANWSLARGIWAYGEGYAGFHERDRAFADFLEQRLEMSMDALDREVLDKYGRYQTVDGLRWPLWFIPGCYCEPYGDAGATADAVQGLTAYLKATAGATDADTRRIRARAIRITTQFAEGLQRMALGDAYTWPFGAIMPNPGYRAAWHGWGTMMPGVLADAGVLLHRKDWVKTAADSMARFAPHVIVQGGPDNFWAPTPVSRIQFGFSVDNLVQNLYKVGSATHSSGIRDLAGITAAWYFGDNYGSAQMYDPATGVLFDGLDGDGNVNRNAGAETAHAVMSMLLLDSEPKLAGRAIAASPVDRHTWKLVEAEDGERTGDTELGEPCVFIVAEGWCSGREVVLRPGGQVKLSVDLPRDGRYVLMPVVQRQQVPAGTVGASVTVDGEELATVDLGGAGPRGVTPRPGYFDVVTVQEPVTARGGSLALTLAYRGQPGQEIRIDGVMVQPLVETHVLGSAEGSQAVLRSFSHRFETEVVRLPGSGLHVRMYDQNGRQLGTMSTRDSNVQAPVAPGGFTIVTSTSLRSNAPRGGH